MPRPFLLLALAALACLALPAARASAGEVGFRVISVPDPQGQPLEVGIWYPTDVAATAPARGMGDLPVAAVAPVAGQRLPLVVMSHGNGGWFGGHYDTAIALAKAGFVAAALTHAGDNYRDQSHATDMADRPRQLHVLIDYMLADWSDHARLDPAKVGAFGFSSGGFTVLAAAGGELDFSRIPAHCRDYPQHYDCQLIARVPTTSAQRAAVWTHDARIRAVVSAAPALGYAFKPQTLAGIAVPVQLWRAADDEILPDPFHATTVRAALPAATTEFHVVPKAGHFDFLAPCDDFTRKNVPAICKSAPDFDRAAFHRDFDKAVVDFFQRTLQRP
ncbi:MAG: dienelactone hydrolase [Caulobacter sp.]|nr:dienelactone hydrolase [Caulobacter sp.]